MTAHAIQTGSKRRVRVTAQWLAGGSSAEAVAGFGAAGLAILALIGVLPVEFTAIATLAAGAGLLVLGAAEAVRFESLAKATASGSSESTALTGGVGAEFAGGIFGVALGILALIGVVPLTLMECGAVLFGGALLVGSMATAELGLVPRNQGSQPTAFVRRSVMAASGAEILIGIGSIALGILALIGIDALILTQVALVGVGVALLLSGSTIAARMARAVR